jgi:NAD(P)-dependent dehydrogenase (short-subunit alcohol dehydrogenase family)
VDVGAAELVASSLGAQAEARAVDVTHAGQVRELFDSVPGAELDAIVHCAAITHPSDGAVADVGPEAWTSIIAVNLTGTFQVCHHGLPLLLRAGGGALVTFGSTAALTGTAFHAYSASKGGVVALSRSIAVTYAASGIRCNAICPGPTNTRMFGSTFPTADGREQRTAQVPAGRAAEPEEIADLAVYLASDESRFLTGAAIPIDGGFVAR